jgi:ferredoxin
MALITISEASCDNSPFCPARRVCPRGAIVPSGAAYRVLQEKCTSCGVCVRACPMGAIQSN